MRKLFFLLTLALLSSNLFAYDFKANGFFYNKLEDGSVEVTYYQTSDLLAHPVYAGDITVPSSVEYDGTTYQVTGIGTGAFWLCEGLTSVVIGNNITFIGASAFSGCIKLAAINIPNSVVSIGDEAFAGCSGLTSIRIGNGVISIGENVLGENALDVTRNNLESITVAEGNPKYIGQGNCLIEKATKTLILGCKNSVIPTDESVTSIGTQAFANCVNLTEMTIPNNITSLDSDAFAFCTGLTAIDFGSGVTSIGTYAFYNCTSLTEITIPRNVRDIGQGAFNGCSGLTSIKAAGRHPVYRSTDNCLYNHKTMQLILGCKTSIIPNDGTITIIGASAFNGCTGLTQITIPACITEIGSGAFAHCSGLAAVTMQGITPPTGTGKIRCKVIIPCNALTAYQADEEWAQLELVEEFLPQLSVTADNIKGEAVIQQVPNCSNNGIAIIKANPYVGYKFASWNDGNRDNPRMIEVTEDITYSAIFAVANNTQPTYVDLGLPSGRLWATCNIGANSPEDAGDYFAWGETAHKSLYTWGTYIWCEQSNVALTKYSIDPTYGFNGFTDDLKILQQQDDAAYVKWGKDWQIPTTDDFTELMNACQTWQWTSINGVNGYKIVGPNGNSIFLPAVGFYYGESGLGEIGIGGGYWCNSLNRASGGTCGDVIYIEPNNTIWMSYATRCYGRTIRAVRTTTDNTALTDCVIDTRGGVQKLFQNGTIYILKPNGEKYTIDGQRVE